MPGLQGFYGSQQVATEIVNDVTAVTRRIYPNECPLITRLRRVPVGSVQFTLFNYIPRKRSWFLGTAIAATTDPLDIQIFFAATGSVVDVGQFQKGDVLQLASGERVEVSQVNTSGAAVVGDPDSGSAGNLANNTIRVRRGRDGTTALASGALNSAVTLIGNSRTGAEVDQNSQRAQRTPIDQWCQTWQFPVQVGGATQSSTNAVLPRGVNSFFDGDKADKLTEMIRDMEYSSYVGGGEAPTTASTSRPKQKGLRTLITTNRVTAPTNAGTYRQTDFVRDMFQRARASAGEIDIVLVSTEFMSGLAIWGLTPQRLEAGNTLLGTPVNEYAIPLLNMRAKFIEAPQLPAFTAVGLTSEEVAWRNKRNEFWNPRGNRGDAIEGEWIAEGGIHLENEAHHVWLEGITAFAA
jgi:hypothetical protein